MVCLLSCIGDLIDRRLCSLTVLKDVSENIGLVMVIKTALMEVMRQKNFAVSVPYIGTFVGKYFGNAFLSTGHPDTLIPLA